MGLRNRGLDGPTFLTVYDDGKGWKLDIQFPYAVLDTRIL